MKSLALALLLLSPSSTFACWAPCPEGKTCYFVEVWDTPEELAKMEEAAGTSACHPNGSVMGRWSTGQAYQFDCVDGKTRITQTSPGNSMRVKGEEPNEPSDEEIAKAANPSNAIPDFHHEVAKCRDQNSCLEAHSEIMQSLAKTDQ